MTSNQAFKKADRRIREVLKTYGYAPNNDLVNQLIAACDPVKQAWSEYVIGEDESTFGPQNEAGDIAPTDYEIMAMNQLRAEQRARNNPNNKEN